MISIDTLRKYYSEDAVFVTEHASMRFRQKGIKAKDIRHAVSNGEIIEQYPEDYPFPSCLILGINQKNEVMHVVCGCNEEEVWIITAYYPDNKEWENDLKTRKGDK